MPRLDAIVFAVPEVGSAHNALVDLPAHSYAAGARYGKAWHCDRGYREVADKRLIVEIPQHAYLSSLGVRLEMRAGVSEK